MMLFFRAEGKVVQAAPKLVQVDVSTHKVRSVCWLYIITPTNKKYASIPASSQSRRKWKSRHCGLVYWEGLPSHFKWCTSYCGLSGNELAELAVKEGTTVKQEGENHHDVSAKTAIRQSTKESILPTTVYVASTAKEARKWTRRRHAVVKEGPSPHHSRQGRTKSPSQSSRKDQVPITVVKEEPSPHHKTKVRPLPVS